MTITNALAASAAALFFGQAIIVTCLIALHQGTSNSQQLLPLSQAPQSKIWLLLCIIAAAMPALGDFLRHLHFYTWSHLLAPWTDAPLLLLGPTLWFYTRSISWQPPDALPTWWNFAPHGIAAALVFLLLLVSAIFDRPSRNIPDNLRAVDEVISLIPIGLHILVYLIAALRRIHHVHHCLPQQLSNLAQRRLHWLILAIALLLILLLIWGISWTWPVAHSDALTNVLLAVWLSVIATFGVQQSHVFSIEKAHRKEARTGNTNPELTVIPQSTSTLLDDNKAVILNPLEGASGSSPKKYAKAALTPSAIESLAQRLENCMAKDKIYLDHELCLADLAQLLGATPHQVSQVLSTHFQQSFYNYVNAWRVRAVQSTFARANSRERTLLEIALECGFGSKSAFNEAFKRVTGMSPSAYRKVLLHATTGQVQTHGDSRKEN